VLALAEARRSALYAAIIRLEEANAALRKRRALAPLERRTERAMRSAFRQQGRAFLARLALLKPYFPPAIREEAAPVPWEGAFDEAALSTIQAFGAPLDEVTTQALAAGTRAAVADLSIEGSFGLEHPAAVDYLRRRGAERVTQITDTTRSRLRTLLGQAADEGWSYDRTAREIRKQYAGFSATRARNIAVFELGDAYEHGNVLVARDLQDGGLAMEKSWLTVGDDRVRPDHRANQGQGWIPLDDAFGSGDDRPPADPGCRCTLLMRRRPDEVRLPEVPPVPSDDDLGKFASLADATRWAEARYPGVSWDFEGAHVDAINPTLAQFHKLAQEYPEVSARLRYVGTYGDIAKRRATPYKSGYDWGDSAAYAHAGNDGTYIGLNPRWYGDAPGFRDSLAYGAKTKWAIGDDIDSVMTHEFGHHVHNWLLSRHKESLVRTVGASGDGVVGDITRQFMDTNRATKALSQYATTNEKESFAEGFAWLYHGTGRKPAYVAKQEALLEATAPAKTLKDGEWRWIQDVPLADRADASAEMQATLTPLYKRLGIKAWWM
jgi:hypothetical protein